MTTPPLLGMRGIVKRYPGVLALDDVNFSLSAGEVHCLVGENGAGKSTLMKILAGAIGKNAGEILIEGRRVEIGTPAASQSLGIGMIYQDFKLVPALTVAENILLGSEPTIPGLPFIDRKAMESTARGALRQLGEEIDVSAIVGDLSVAQRQTVEIAKAISRKVRILALDEPTTSLTEHEIQNLFGVIRRLKAEGVGIIYISHRLEEVFEIGDRVTVLRDGKMVETRAVAEVDRRQLIRWMVGRELENEFPGVHLQRGDETLRLEHVTGGRLKDITLSLHRGEILGLAGLVGAGRSEVARLIFGADRKESGSIFLDGCEINPRSPREAIDLGIGLLTEDRNRYGLIAEMNVRENITLSNLRDLLTGPFISGSKEKGAAMAFVDQLRIKAPSLEVRVESLSGGNRQKVVLARWLHTRSKVLVFDEPTAGIDVGAKYEIYTLVNRLAAEGTGIVMISSDLLELLGMSDRIVVMCEGRVSGELTRSEATQERIMTLATSFRRVGEMPNN